MVNKIHIKVVSCLISIWYLLSIVGFNVHTCSGTGDVFVNSLVSGNSCEMMHPSHTCHHETHCDCGHDHNNDVSVEYELKDCCENETVVFVQDCLIEDPIFISQLHSSTNMIAMLCQDIFEIQSDSDKFFQRKIPDPVSSLHTQRDILSEISIWRL